MLARSGAKLANAAIDERQLDEAILEALRPGSLRARLELRLAGGWSAIQVLDRLPEPVRAALAAQSERDVLARRESVDRVSARLHALLAAGRVRRRRASLATDVRVKGIRLIEVDLFSRA